MAERVLNASDIKVYAGGTKIAHITDAQLTIDHEPRIVFSNDTAPGEEKSAGKITWGITGNSLIVMGGGYSLGDLMAIMLARQPVAVQFTTDVTGDNIITGNAILRNITGGGATEQNATCSFNFEGSGDPTLTTVGATTTAAATTTI
jgi:hypothetical protein